MGQGPLSADVLARAAERLLDVDGTGISVLVEDLRLPLGASSATMRRAEELQTSLGDGPCLLSAQTGAPVRADLSELRRRWPLYASELVRQTPYRSAAALPLRTADGKVFAALDLLSEDPQLDPHLDLDEVAREIATPMGVLLDMCMYPVRDAGGLEVLPAWYERATARRQDVWVALGMVMSHLHSPGHDALDVLRAYAFSHDRSLDDVADDVVHHRLRVQDLTG